MIEIAAIVGSIVFLIAVAFYILVTLGAPLGEYLMSGKYKVLPSKMRVMTGVSVLIQLLAVLVLLQGGGSCESGFTYHNYKASLLCFCCLFFVKCRNEPFL